MGSGLPYILLWPLAGFTEIERTVMSAVVSAVSLTVWLPASAPVSVRPVAVTVLPAPTSLPSKAAVPPT